MCTQITAPAFCIVAVVYETFLVCMHMYIPTCFFTALIGFEGMEYDVSEHEDARVCIILMNGVLIQDITLEINSHEGTAGYVPMCVYWHYYFSTFASKVCGSVYCYTLRSTQVVYAHEAQCTFGYIIMCIQ